MKFLSCVFGYIALSSLTAGAIVNHGERWMMYVFLALFLIGWVFVIGFATCDRATMKAHLLQGWEMARDWLAFMGIMIAGSAILALFAS